ncbi:MAG: hypothetical protein ACK5XM_16550, partial [Betaproteobacteria bacterium]
TKKDAQTKKVHDSFFAFKRTHDKGSVICEVPFLVTARTCGPGAAAALGPQPPCLSPEALAA